MFMRVFKFTPGALIVLIFNPEPPPLTPPYTPCTSTDSVRSRRRLYISLLQPTFVLYPTLEKRQLKSA